MIRLPKHHVEDVGRDHRGERRDESRIVLVVGADHDDDVGVEPERLGVAGLLVAAVPEVGGVDERAQPERAGGRGGAVVAGVVDQEHVVHDVRRQVRDRLPERPRGVAGRQDHHHLPAVDQGGPSSARQAPPHREPPYRERERAGPFAAGSGSLTLAVRIDGAIPCHDHRGFERRSNCVDRRAYHQYTQPIAAGLRQPVGVPGSGGTREVRESIPRPACAGQGRSKARSVPASLSATTRRPA